MQSEYHRSLIVNTFGTVLDLELEKLNGPDDGDHPPSGNAAPARPLLPSSLAATVNTSKFASATGGENVYDNTLPPGCTLSYTTERKGKLVEGTAADRTTLSANVKEEPMDMTPSKRRRAGNLK